ncbi:hypothetical protein C8R44DRAFT_874351 [Mycena epipterygia]|nr:hypothetical protein C8R44DRAFT_874351 [Mycena epipterygia]
MTRHVSRLELWRFTVETGLPTRSAPNAQPFLSVLRHSAAPPRAVVHSSSSANCSRSHLSRRRTAPMTRSEFILRPTFVTISSDARRVSHPVPVDCVCASAPPARSPLLLHSSHVPPLHLPSFGTVCAVTAMCGPHFAHPFFAYARAFVRQ